MFVTFEGVDLSGKRRRPSPLSEWFRAQGRTVLAPVSPGARAVGEAVRKVVLHGDDMSPWAEAALYAAARAEHVGAGDPPGARARRGRRVRPLHRLVGRLPGRARGLGEDKVLELNLTVTEGCDPIDVPGAARAGGGAPPRGDEPDRIEREGDEFMRRVDAAYRSLAAVSPTRIVALDGERPAEEIAEEVREHIRELL